MNAGIIGVGAAGEVGVPLVLNLRVGKLLTKHGLDGVGQSFDKAIGLVISSSGDGPCGGRAEMRNPAKS